MSERSVSTRLAAVSVSLLVMMSLASCGSSTETTTSTSTETHEYGDHEYGDHEYGDHEYGDHDDRDRRRGAVDHKHGHSRRRLSWRCHDRLRDRGNRSHTLEDDRDRE